MHNKTKVNTNYSAVATSEAKNNIFAAKHIGILTTPYGALMIDSFNAADHAAMRGQQLSSLLRLMQGEGWTRLSSLGPAAQDSLLWLAIQLADEMQDMVDVVAADAQGEGV